MNGLSRRPLRGLAAALALGTALPAFAQDMPDVVEEDKVKAQLEETAKLAAEKPLEGWQYKLDVGFNAGYNHSSTVVGQPDGATLQLGIAVNGAADLYAGQHEWHNSLTIAHQQTKTPAIDPFVKTSDNFELMTMWLYKPVVLPWLGPFARARLQTQIFAGHLVFGEDKNLAIRDVDGNVVLPGDLTTITVDQADGTTKQFSQLPAQEEYKLTDPFEPLTLRQSVGAFARALDRNDVKVTFTLGLGAQEVLTQEGYTLADDDKTNELEIKQLQDSQQVGVEVGAEASGTIGQQITWSVNANTLYPFIVEADTDLEGVDLTNVEFNGKVGVKLAKWASLDYVLTAKRIPLVLDDWQVQNGVLLSTAFNLL
ncbi:MAG: hypothetical protein KC549_09535 [Myxococcales bacterium]|nr:hypothetical protein [Myxococcales bacterium]MCB9548683.1 hypothetical protein [Myxococcales bacterium]